MNRDALEALIQETMATIQTLPAERRIPLLKLVAETRERHEQIREYAKRAQEAVDDWRLIQKYMIFDAEASAREAAERNSRSRDDETA